MQNKKNFIQFFKENASIVIPQIQRDYAQGRTDERTKKIRTKFLDSLYDAVTNKPITLDYIYGDKDRDGKITLLDGQQRITTLFLLYWYAAKHDQVPKEQYEFLRQFTYETRYSSTQFCKKIIDYEMDVDATESLSSCIEDQNWFPLSWKQDPTIRGMLVMLDCINKKFRNVDNLWNKLQGDAITFYFQPISDMGQTDDLYIKMNSRGKPLSEFENFKAELEGELEKLDPELAYTIARKIDGAWTDLLWHYQDPEHTIDDAFLNCFRAVCQMICYRREEQFSNKNYDGSGLIEYYFRHDLKDARQNIDTLVQFFDGWTSLLSKKSPILEEWFGQYLSFEHTDGKIKLSSFVYRKGIDLLYELTTVDKQYSFSKLSLLYAFVVYVEHRSKINESNFRRRIRIINNLIRNSDDELNDDESRGGGNRMPAIFRQIEHILLKGQINTDESPSFNAHQLEEEKNKLGLTEAHPEIAASLFELEDHALLYGQVGIIGVEVADADLYPRFAELFRCSLDKVCQAMIATGDYFQELPQRFYYQFGASVKLEPWQILFHHSGNKGYDKTRIALRSLLKEHEHFSDEVLDAIASSYLIESEENSSYNWRYYYIKYSAFRPETHNGKFYAANSYEPLIVTTDSRCSEKAYSPFLKAVQELASTQLYLESFKGRKNILLYGSDCYNFNEHCICVYENDPDAMDDPNEPSSYVLKTEISIEQDIDSIDKEDRIKKLADLITNPQPE